MRCFVHHDADAVAVCRSCLKGACAACAQPVTLGIACSDTCLPIADRIAKVQLATSHNLVIARLQRTVVPVGGLVFLGVAYDSLRYNIYSVLGWCAAAGAVLTLYPFVRSWRR